MAVKTTKAHFKSMFKDYVEYPDADNITFQFLTKKGEFNWFDGTQKINFSDMKSGVMSNPEEDIYFGNVEIDELCTIPA